MIVDCFDSFTYNIYHSLSSLEVADVQVIRYDKLNDFDFNGYTHLVLSPGPGIPQEYPLIQSFLDSGQFKTVLGVCLGMQYLVTSYGGKLKRLHAPMHGVESKLVIKSPGVLFRGIGEGMSVGHYHSWVASEECFPHDDFQITSTDTSGNIMSIESKNKPLFGVQFHPESILTTKGSSVFKNWLTGTKSF